MEDVDDALVETLWKDLGDGQIIIDTKDEETVSLILDGVAIACSTSAPIYVSNAEKTVITLADRSENTITDGDAYVFGDAEPDAQAVVVSSPELENDTTYVVYTGGSLTGTVTDGLYTAGTQVASFAITSMVTGESTGMGGFPGGLTGGGRCGRP